ncbi:uncharacterized protein LOC129907891 [Episyrphus balteatus]|uniref:uncharacterized protein LOC129907891 n=1 Tax=Episyrphus balteatus TaxID=286459 RepID=UPI002485E36B|nr:uncharacterized protein LOC129907891 [Episyrphus balteatus]
MCKQNERIIRKKYPYSNEFYLHISSSSKFKTQTDNKFSSASHHYQHHSSRSSNHYQSRESAPRPHHQQDSSSSSFSSGSSSSSSSSFHYHSTYHKIMGCDHWHIIHLIILLIDLANGITMTELKIPNHIMRFKTAVLGCRYSLDGESLYSVKWYKDGYEFYRYLPRDSPPGQAFPLPGVNIDLRNSSDTIVTLRRVTLSSTGLYRCEVSGEAPAFNTVSESEKMTVVMTPNHGPKITGGQPRYQIGDVVRVNCTSAPSKPVCHLSWLINGEPANQSHLKKYDNIVVGREGLEVARLGLEFRVRGFHFKNGDMKLKCVAKISSLYWQSNEESVESDKQQRAPALESRETVAAKSQVHGSSAATKSYQSINWISTIILALASTKSLLSTYYINYFR